MVKGVSYNFTCYKTHGLATESFNWNISHHKQLYGFLASPMAGLVRSLPNTVITTANTSSSHFVELSKGIQ